MLSTKRPPCLIDAEDQFVGVQEDSERDYMVETRGKDKTVMWLEVQPYGTPRQPEGPAQAPDPRLKEKGHKGSKSSKGSKAMASQAPGTPGRGPYRVTKAIPLETLLWEIQEHIVVPVNTGGTTSLGETVFPGAWWHGRVGRMRSLGETHFRPRVVDRALLLQEDHPLRLCTIRTVFHGAAW